MQKARLKVGLSPEFSNSELISISRQADRPVKTMVQAKLHCMKIVSASDRPGCSTLTDAGVTKVPRRSSTTIWLN